MTMRLFPCLLAVALAAPAAGEAMSAETFETLAEGHVLRFSHRGAPFGAEQYFPGRRSLWQYADGSCANGVWWDDAGSICFRYDGRADTQCWRFAGGPEAFSAELVEEGAGTGFILDFAGRDETPLPCPAPDLGS